MLWGRQVSAWVQGGWDMFTRLRNSTRARGSRPASWRKQCLVFLEFKAEVGIWSRVRWEGLGLKVQLPWRVVDSHSSLHSSGT